MRLLDAGEQLGREPEAFSFGEGQSGSEDVLGRMGHGRVQRRVPYRRPGRRQAAAVPRGAVVCSGEGIAMHAYKLNVNVADDHRIAVELPEDFPPGPAEVIVLAVTPTERRLVRVLGSLGGAAPASVEDDPVAGALAELRSERARRFDAAEEPETET
ncbi:hypothetical protein [Sorangium cellulosum]|uniref:hypothetical protein n=1 Tax=Sorangium cellulosum TaxID=56 RepID=UPI00138AB6A3|nr:hypothetical protein [Sorangium cellulosum]